MYSNLNLYYLDQLGIRPWIKRPSTEITTKNNLMIVLLDDKPNQKAQSLLNKMLKFIGLETYQLKFLSDSALDKPSLANAAIVLNLSSKKELAIQENITLVESHAPEYLLSRPIDKKLAYQQLLKIKNHLE